MAILGIGTDIIDLGRIERLHRRHGAAFVRRFCRDGEWETRKGNALYEHLGGLWAAKEAMLKALGTGWAQGLAFRQVEVVRLESGAPTVRLHDAAREHAERLGVSKIHVSISHERGYAVAMALIEGGPTS